MGEQLVSDSSMLQIFPVYEAFLLYFAVLFVSGVKAGDDPITEVG